MTCEHREKILRDLNFPADFVPRVTFHLCSKHFTPESIENRGKISVLKADATVAIEQKGEQNYIPQSKVALSSMIRR